MSEKKWEEKKVSLGSAIVIAVALGVGGAAVVVEMRSHGLLNPIGLPGVEPGLQEQRRGDHVDLAAHVPLAQSLFM